MNTETRLDVRRIWFAPVSVRMVCRMLRIANGLKSALCQCASSSSATREEGSHIVDNTWSRMRWSVLKSPPIAHGMLTAV